MQLRILWMTTLLLLPFGLRANAETVEFSLSSPDAGGVVPGQLVNWSISAEITSGGSEGLALFVVDFVQDPSNPELFDMLPANGVPVGLEGFSRPAGISNPGEGGATTGYVGVQRGTPGAQDLVQIGGAQNNTGAAGVSIGLDVNLEAGLGLSGPVVIAQGAFTAPNTNGTYTFRLVDAVANTFEAVNPAGVVSPVNSADTMLASDSFQITVSTAPIIGDLNCDGSVDTNDIQDFAQALVDPIGYIDDHDGDPFPICDVGRADINLDEVTDGRDVAGFVSLLVGP